MYNNIDARPNYTYYESGLPTTTGCAWATVYAMSSVYAVEGWRKRAVSAASDRER